MSTEPSIFTKIINREIPGFIPYENETLAVLVALEGHLLVVPKVHYKDVYELPEEVGAEIMKTAIRMAKALQAVTGCDGINLVQSNGSIAGQEVFHFHLHIKPRFANDDVVFAWDTSTKPEIERQTLCNSLKDKISL